jgi:isoleucyl-tRNA synthetase
MQELDRYLLARWEGVKQRLYQAYDDYDFHLVYHHLLSFCSVDLSAFYLDVLKDTLYADAADDPVRRSAQTAIYLIADEMLRLMAPIFSFTADEAWQHLPRHETASIHLALFAPRHDDRLDATLLERWRNLLDVRGVVTKGIEVARDAGQLKESAEVDVVLTGAAEIRELIAGAERQLVRLFKVAAVRWADELPGDATAEGAALGGVRVRVEPTTAPKCPRCWNRDSTVGRKHAELCERCATVLASS